MFTAIYIYVAIQIYAFEDEPVAAWLGLAAFVWGDFVLATGVLHWLSSLI